MLATTRKVLLLIILGLSTGTLGLFYYSETRSSTHKQSNLDDGLAVEISDFNLMMNSIGGQTLQLQTLSILNASTVQGPGFVPNQTRQGSRSNLDYAQLAAPTLQGTIRQLDAERSQFQSLIGQSADASVTGAFFYRSTLAYYVVGGAYANVGLRTAYSTSVTIIFYSQSDGQGLVLCRMKYRLGDVPAESIVSIDRLQCGSGSVPIGSVSFQFEWWAS